MQSFVLDPGENPFNVVEPGKMWIRKDVPAWVRDRLSDMGYTLELKERTSGPITAIWFDREHGSMWGAASNYGDDYGIAW